MVKGDKEETACKRGKVWYGVIEAGVGGRRRGQREVSEI
jgi:hypothetical protein